MEIFSALLVALVGGVLAVFVVRDLGRNERRWSVLSFAAHMVSSVIHWATLEVFYGGVNDARGYHELGLQLARLLEIDFARFAPQVVNLALHRETLLPVAVFGDGTSTGTMSALAGMLSFVAGSSLLTLYLIAACASWFGATYLYRFAREELGQEYRSAALIGCYGVPSVVFWSAGFCKEAFVVTFLGVLVFSTHRLLRRRRSIYLVGVVVGGVGVAVLKSYTIFAFVLAAAAFVYTDRAWRSRAHIQLNFAYLAVAVGIALGGMAVMGRLFPEFGTERVAQTIALNQETWGESARASLGGGSSVEVGSGDARTVVEQLRYVPAAFVNVFFRPLIFEARNAPMMVAALENATFVAALLSILAGGARASTWERLLRSPFLVASVVFCLVFGIGVGLATGNLGSLSRYRMPMLPFFVTTLVVLWRSNRGAAEDTLEVVAGRGTIAPRPSRRRDDPPQHAEVSHRGEESRRA